VCTFWIVCSSRRIAQLICWCFLLLQSSIIRALEIYTRGSVFTTVSELQLREKDKAVKISKESQHVSSESSQRSDTQMYDAVLEDEFDTHPAQQHHVNESNSLGESVDSNRDDVDDSMEEDSDGNSEIEGMLKCAGMYIVLLRINIHVLSSSPR